MYIYDKEASVAARASISRNTATGSSVRSLDRKEGRQGDTVYYSRYESPDCTFEFATHPERGHRQAKAILPDPVFYHDLSSEEWRELRKRRMALRDELNISHDEIVNVGHKMPLDPGVAEDLMRLVWTSNNQGGVQTYCNFTIGFLNTNPNATRGQDTPYLKLDQNGVFSVGVNGKW